MTHQHHRIRVRADATQRPQHFARRRMIECFVVNYARLDLQFRQDQRQRVARAAKRTASSAALNRARALFTHSACSRSGTESATMPAPACTYIVPSFTTEVLSTMQLSISPPADKYPTHPA